MGLLKKKTWTFSPTVYHHLSNQHCKLYAFLFFIISHVWREKTDLMVGVGVYVPAHYHELHGPENGCL
jgi:hypothetical protein